MQQRAHTYPSYRVEPGTSIPLSEEDPAASGHYRKKREVREELEAHRRRIVELQARLYAENKRGLLIVLQATGTGGRTARSGTSSGA